jgi:hypothetical protein
MQGKHDLISLSDYVFGRTWRRLDGLTNSEYFWEPVPGCWSVHVGRDDVATVDRARRPDPPPFTTIAWRLWHLIDCYGADRNEQLLLSRDDGAGDFRCAPRPTAETALAAFEHANGWWRDLLSRLTEGDLSAPLGPAAGPYADDDKAAYVLHQLDEMIHHGAELGVLRDMYAARDPRRTG